MLDTNPSPLNTLFPPELGLGSFGAAVEFLQSLLFAYGCAEEDLTIDGQYGKVDSPTYNSVMSLQRKLGMDEKDVNGIFDQKTRVQLKDAERIDVNAIPSALYNKKTFWINDAGEKRTWPAGGTL